jgi:hypothetical protein
MYQRFGKKGVKEGRSGEVEGIKDGYGHFFQEEALVLLLEHIGQFSDSVNG